MAVYTVQRGDTLSGIAKKLGVPSWQILYNANKSVIGSNPNIIKIGQRFTYGTPSSTTPKPASATPAPLTEAQKLVNPLPIVAPKAFTEYMPWETFFPKTQVDQFTTSQVDPEYNRIREQQTGQFDWKSAISNAFRTGAAQRQRQQLNDEISRARAAEYANLFGQQKDLFSSAYGQEEDKYSKDPTKYVPTDYVTRFLK